MPLVTVVWDGVKPPDSYKPKRKPRKRHGKFEMFEPEIKVSDYKSGWGFECKSREISQYLSKKQRVRRVTTRIFRGGHVIFQATGFAHKRLLCGKCRVKNRCKAYSYPHLEWFKEKKFGLCGYCGSYICDPLYMYILYKIRDFLPKAFKSMCCDCQSHIKVMKMIDEQIKGEEWVTFWKTEV